ncbi:DUF2637 domain-containing protein [Streptomyces sp. AJS327]|uniref:DUF2637 domain-containing protein n=1 Tax=Streptomyces sp. AJS327 TaxID=2545265 RepID=UPI0015DEB02A|nr:DUF2637 domain-containing protein [Streptomyces sp. AJS327]MBA0052099.1 DUF2637 domain-containing protein [Streptomyces sp. AJS327]
MGLMETPLNWVAAGAVLLAGALAAVVVMGRGRKRDTGGAAGEPQERMEERHRRKETVYATAAYLLLFCCAGVAAALSFHGLVGFGRQNLNLSGGWEYLVPFGLDGAAMFSAVIAVREASHGDASLGSRLLVWTFAAAAAWFNWVHAPRGAGHAGAPEFFAGMSLSAAILFDRALKQTRRAALREQGLVPRPLPQIRVVRWLRAPRETYGAWSLMLLENVRTLDEAVDEVREERRQREQERAQRKEHARLERAQVRALNRQHRLWSWGGANRRTGLSPGTAAQQGAGPSGGTGPAEALPPAPSARAALEPATEDEGSGRWHRVHGTVPGARTEQDRLGDRAERAPEERRETAAERRAKRRAAAESSGASSAPPHPRLDSLEEKLAEIERQFG